MPQTDCLALPLSAALVPLLLGFLPRASFPLRLQIVPCAPLLSWRSLILCLASSAALCVLLHLCSILCPASSCRHAPPPPVGSCLDVILPPLMWLCLGSVSRFCPRSCLQGCLWCLTASLCVLRASSASIGCAYVSGCLHVESPCFIANPCFPTQVCREPLCFRLDRLLACTRLCTACLPWE